MVEIEIEYHEPEQTERVCAGTFFFNRPEDGAEVEAKFYVKCAPHDPHNPTVCDARVDALNTQFTDMYSQLQGQGCYNIKYKDCIPSPFF